MYEYMITCNQKIYRRSSAKASFTYFCQAVSREAAIEICTALGSVRLTA